MDKKTKKKVFDFLNSDEGNYNLAKIMECKGYWIEIKDLPLKNVFRVAGDEKDIKFPQKKEFWKRRTTKMIKDLKNGWKPFPFILWCEDGRLSVADGNKRFFSMKKAGIKKYSCYIWFKDKKQYELFKQKP